MLGIFTTSGQQTQAPHSSGVAVIPANEKNSNDVGTETPASVVSMTPSTSTSTSTSTSVSVSVCETPAMTETTRNTTPSSASVCTEKPRRQVVIDPNIRAQPMSGEYTHDRALEDIPGVAQALALFLASHMVESEKFCHESDPKKERLYFASGYGLIQCVKALMSYEDQDLMAAIGHTKHGNAIASQHRKKAASITSRIAGLVIGSNSSSGVGFVKSMTAVERHAELIYAETLFQKALLGIVYSGDWLAFIKEALNLRTTFTTYRQLAKFIEVADADARQLGQPYDASIDADFRSGVLLGAGLSNIILSLMPSRLLSIVELFGYHGNRSQGLKMLYEAGGWSTDKDEPAVSAQDEGLRRSICDMVLLIFHLVLSSFTHTGVDIPLAQKILQWNLSRYPSGVFFLFGHGRLALLRAQSRQAIVSYTAAMHAQTQYANLQHISLWEIAVAWLALGDVQQSLDCWRRLEKEATWSKAVYTYGAAACLLQIGGEENVEEAKKYLEKVPKVLQRIAGKSIPMEKFVARKSRKFTSQRHRLTLPALEFGYFLLVQSHAQPPDIRRHMLPDIWKVKKVLAEFCGVFDAEGEMGDGLGDGAEKAGKKKSEKEYEGGSGGFWDDFALVSFLEGVCWRYVAHPEPLAIVDASLDNELEPISREEAERRATVAFERVLGHGSKIELDHYLVYFTHFELGRLRACMGDEPDARKHFEMILSGKVPEVNAAGRKGKYSLESGLMIRTNAALEMLGQSEQKSSS